MLTKNELLALECLLEIAIARSQAEDDGDPLFHDVDALEVNPFTDKFILSGVHSSLAEKGLIECSLMEDLSTGEITEYVCITPDGIEALKSAKGVN